ncbi:MAG TPA: DUF2207 domain-containing protein [Dermatophilaceae bacterium]
MQLLGRVRSRVRGLLTVLAVFGLTVWFVPAAQAAAGGVPTAGVRPVAISQAVQGERVLSFTADYNVAADGSVGVTETLVWQFGPGEHHGIKRNITVRQGVPTPPGKYRFYEMSDVGASSPTGANADVYVSDLGADSVIRIGSPTVPFEGAQQQTYVVKYRLAHVANGFPDHAELYWNVTGASFDLPVDSVKVTVHGPAAVTDALCFQGADRSAAPCQASSGQTATYAATGLGPRQQVTIVASFPASAITDTAPDLRDGDTGFSGGGSGSQMSPTLARGLGLLGYGGGLALPALAAALMGTLVWKRGRDEQYAGLTPGLTPVEGAPGPVTHGQEGPVAVQFAPPEGVRPGLVGTIIDEQANTIDVSATVVDLAVRGYLRIEEVESGGLFKRADWQLTKLVPPDQAEVLLPYEETLFAGIFADSNPVLLSGLKNKFHTTLTTAQSQMYSEVTRRGWFRKSPEKARRGWTTLGLFVMGGGLVSGWFLGFQSADTDRVGGLSFAIPSGIVLAGGLLVAGAIIWVLGQRMAAKTASGSAVLAQSLGFKQYLVTAEARQIRFEEAQDIFSRYLPYAIVFGVADRWAGVFSEVAEAATAAGQSIGMPGWYVFAGSGGFGNFGGIASGMDSFSTMASGTFTSTPGSSGGSGFGGGGFSGGGGGGGGGSSW